jgi:hypothetical protein
MFGLRRNDRFNLVPFRWINRSWQQQTSFGVSQRLCQQLLSDLLQLNIQREHNVAATDGLSGDAG